MRFSLNMAGRRRRQAAALGALACATTLLAACGQATVENNDSTSIAPLTRSAAASESSSSAAASSKASGHSSEPSGSASAEANEPDNLDQGQQISAIPSASDNYTGKEKAFLDELTKAGIDVSGAEGQMIGAAGVACENLTEGLAPATIQAVAGQLIQQGRTNKPFEEVVSLIESTAKNAYC